MQSPGDLLAPGERASDRRSRDSDGSDSQHGGFDQVGVPATLSACRSVLRCVMNCRARTSSCLMLDCTMRPVWPACLPMLGEHRRAGTESGVSRSAQQQVAYVLMLPALERHEMATNDV